MMRHLPLLLGISFLLCSGCYQSHADSPDPLTDAGRGRVDSGPRTGDGGSLRDAGDRTACEGIFEVLDRIEIPWQGADCGGVMAPQVVSRNGADPAFELVVTEERFCDDRPAQVWARGVGTEAGRLQLGEASALGIALEPALAASHEGRVAICTGRNLYLNEGTTWSSAELRPLPAPTPGRLLERRCLGLTHDGAGWATLWGFFTRHSGNFELSRSGEQGGLRGPVVEEEEGHPRSVAGYDGAFASLVTWLAPARSSMLLWPLSESSPHTVDLDPSGVDPRSLNPAAIAHSPWLDNGWLIVRVGDGAVELRAVDQDGALIWERVHEGIVVPGYDIRSINVEAGGFGVVVGLGQTWAGARTGSASTLLVTDPRGELLMPVISQEFEGRSREQVIDVAAEGNEILVHRLLSEDRTEALLLGCR